MNGENLQSIADDVIITQTKQWIEEVVIGLNFCPFAKRVFDKSLIHYQLANNKNTEDDLFSLLDLCNVLDTNKSLETGFVIYPHSLVDFNDYLDFLALANQLLEAREYDGEYQLASFHPDYCFDATSENAAENYTNRSPYPMLHLLREDSLEKALEYYENPEEIPLRNIDIAQQKGAEYFSSILNKIKND